MQTELNQRHRDDRKEQNERSRRGMTKFTKLETIIVYKQICCQRAVKRFSLSPDERFLEKLEPADHRRNGHEENSVTELRNGDITNLLPYVGAVKLGCFIKRARNPFNTLPPDTWRT